MTSNTRLPSGLVVLSAALITVVLLCSFVAAVPVLRERASELNVTITRTILGDVNGDKTVNVLDLIVIANVIFSHPGSSKWNPNADLNNDNSINVLDLIICAGHLGQHW